MDECKKVGGPMFGVTPAGLAAIQHDLDIRNQRAGYEKYEIWRHGPTGGPYTVEIYECPMHAAVSEQGVWDRLARTK